MPCGTIELRKASQKQFYGNCKEKRKKGTFMLNKFYKKLVRFPRGKATIFFQIN